MNAQQIAKAINKLRPQSEYTFSDNDYSTIKWIVLEGEAPTIQEIQATISSIETIEANKAEADAATKAALLDRLGITAEEAALLLS